MRITASARLVTHEARIRQQAFDHIDWGEDSLDDRLQDNTAIKKASINAVGRMRGTSSPNEMRLRQRGAEVVPALAPSLSA